MDDRAKGKTDLEDLRDRMREFAREREWDPFHSPKNLSMALAVEASELMEVFQWLTEAQSRAPSAESKAAAAEEIADVLLYLVRIADQLAIDPADAARRKIAANARKYPADKARGSIKKYTEL